MQRNSQSTGGNSTTGPRSRARPGLHPAQPPTDQPLSAEPVSDDDAAPGTPWMSGSVIDRRLGLDRREIAARLGREGITRGEESTGLDRRRGPGRRRTDFAKSAEEGEMTSEQFLFVMAIDAFKKANGKMFPTWTDVLEVVRLLGYRKTMASELNLKNVEDWREPGDTPSGVRAKPGHPEDRRQRDAA
jgi:hypothetical protein